jgi:hypothetical protein
MNDSLIRKFCESRHRWPIVATATVLLALAVVWPLVDDYFDKGSSRSGLSENLVRARQTAESLPKFEERAGGVQKQLAALETRTVDDASLPRYRSRLVEIVRESGCQIRRIEVGAPTRRQWKDKDNPLADPLTPVEGAATPFALERRSVSLGVDGSMSAIHDLLSRLEKEQSLSHPHRLQLQAVSGNGDSVTLELELWLFALSRSAA